MKKIYLGFVLILLAYSCSSPEKLLMRGDYDGIIDKSIKKIIKVC